MMTTPIKQYEQSQPKSSHFDIFAAFEKLETNRKLSLCDQLFHSGNFAYLAMAQKFWPEANELDMLKLERLLRTRIERTMAANQ